MSVRGHRLPHLIVTIVLPVALLVGGCCPRCATRCTPHGPWQSPTINTTHALLLVNTPELHVLRVDGRNVHPSCIGADGVREYHMPPGMHTVTATFSYAAPVYGGVIGAMRGTPTTVRCRFQVGHEYVSLYREHLYPRREAESFFDAAAATLAGSDRYWSLAIRDLAETDGDPEPEVIEARHYCAAIRDLVASAGDGASLATY